MLPASEKELEGWTAADKFTVVMETAGLNATQLSANCRERGLLPEQVSRWRQAAQDAREKAMAEMAALLVLRKSGMPSIRRMRKAD